MERVLRCWNTTSICRRVCMKYQFLGVPGGSNCSLVSKKHLVSQCRKWNTELDGAKVLSFPREPKSFGRALNGSVSNMSLLITMPKRIGTAVLELGFLHCRQYLQIPLPFTDIIAHITYAQQIRRKVEEAYNVKSVLSHFPNAQRAIIPKTFQIHGVYYYTPASSYMFIIFFQKL